MKSICIIHCWFGQEHSLMKYWLKSCEYNKTIDFLVFSDIEVEHIPDNVKWMKTSLENVKTKIQDCFDFQITLDAAYKLCDFKPAYGEVFQSYIHGYEYWGYCDSDLIFGDIRKWVTDEIMDDYERIYTRGHLSIFRNTGTVNAYYRTLSADGCLDYKDVFTTSEGKAFDEWSDERHKFGISMTFRKNGILQYDERDFADVDFTRHRFQWSENKSGYFKYDKGHLYAIYDSGKQKEILYAHFQKRKFKVLNSKENIDQFTVFPIHFIQNGESGKQIPYKCGIYAELYRFIWKRLKAKLGSRV